MRSPSDSISSSLESSTCYFTYVPSSTHFSAETPHSPLTAFSEDIHPDCAHPLLATRPLDHLPLLPLPTMDPSKLLQLQTAAAHGQATRPRAQPLQPTGSSTSIVSTSSGSSSSSSSSSTSEQSMSMPPSLCCARCRRSSAGAYGMVQFGTNLYYCSHCASMTGYSAG